MKTLIAEVSLIHNCWDHEYPSITLTAASANRAQRIFLTLFLRQQEQRRRNIQQINQRQQGNRRRKRELALLTDPPAM